MREPRRDVAVVRARCRVLAGDVEVDGEQVVGVLGCPLRLARTSGGTSVERDHLRVRVCDRRSRGAAVVRAARLRTAARLEVRGDAAAQDPEHLDRRVVAESRPNDARWSGERITTSCAPSAPGAGRGRRRSGRGSAPRARATRARPARRRPVRHTSGGVIASWPGAERAVLRARVLLGRVGRDGVRAGGPRRRRRSRAGPSPGRDATPSVPTCRAGYVRGPVGRSARRAPRRIRRMTSVVVLGGGPAGNTCASVAATLGAEVTLVERDIVGGAAHLWDCIPSKAMIATGGELAELGSGAVDGAARRGPARHRRGQGARVVDRSAAARRRSPASSTPSGCACIMGTGDVQGPARGRRRDRERPRGAHRRLRGRRHRVAAARAGLRHRRPRACARRRATRTRRPRSPST